MPVCLLLCFCCLFVQQIVQADLVSNIPLIASLAIERFMREIAQETTEILREAECAIIVIAILNLCLSLLGDDNNVMFEHNLRRENNGVYSCFDSDFGACFLFLLSLVKK